MHLCKRSCKFAYGIQNFGVFLKREIKEGRFWFTNIGQDLLVVHDVITSCGCTAAQYSKLPVRPNDTMELVVCYEADEKGRFYKSMTIYSNAIGSPHKVWIKGVVK